MRRSVLVEGYGIPLGRVLAREHAETAIPGARVTAVERLDPIGTASLPRSV
jgi:hypothetical protein